MIVCNDYGFLPDYCFGQMVSTNLGHPLGLPLYELGDGIILNGALMQIGHHRAICYVRLYIPYDSSKKGKTGIEVDGQLESLVKEIGEVISREEMLTSACVSVRNLGNRLGKSIWSGNRRIVQTSEEYNRHVKRFDEVVR